MRFHSSTVCDGTIDALWESYLIKQMPMNDIQIQRQTTSVCCLITELTHHFFSPGSGGKNTEQMYCNNASFYSNRMNQISLGNINSEPNR